MKRISPLIAALFLVACTSAPSQGAIQTAIAQTQGAAPAQSSITAVTPRPTLDSQSISEFRDVASNETSGLKLTISRLAVGDPAAMSSYAISPKWTKDVQAKQAAYWAAFKSMGAIEITAENTGSDELSLYLYDGSIVINGEQINPFQSSLDAYVYLNNFNTLLPSAHSTMGIFFGLRDTAWQPDFSLSGFAYSVKFQRPDGDPITLVVKK